MRTNQRPDPTPADIAARCLSYQRSWSDADRQERLGQRRGRHRQAGDWALPVVRTPAHVVRKTNHLLEIND